MKNLFIFSVCIIFSLTLFNIARAEIKPFGGIILDIEKEHPEGIYNCVNPESTIINFKGIIPGIPPILITNSQARRYQTKTLKKGQWVLGLYDTSKENKTCELKPPGGSPSPYSANPIKIYGNSFL